MRKILCILLLAAAWGASLPAQDLLEVKRVELDSLVHFLRGEFQPDIYYIKDDAEQSTFTVSAPRAQFLEAASRVSMLTLAPGESISLECKTPAYSGRFEVVAEGLTAAGEAVSARATLNVR